MARLNLLPLVGDMPMGKRSDNEILAALEAEIAGLEAVQRAVDDAEKAIQEAAAGHGNEDTDRSEDSQSKHASQ